MNDSIEKRVEGVLKLIKPDMPETVGKEDDLFQTGILDSFGVINFISALEQEFKVSIPDEDLIPQNLWSITATANTVQKHMGKS